MHVTAAAPDYTTLTVREILPGSDAAQAGFQTGDCIIEVSELGKAPLLIANLYPLLHTPGSYHVTVRRNEQTLPLVLQIHDPFAGIEPAPAK